MVFVVHCLNLCNRANPDTVKTEEAEIDWKTQKSQEEKLLWTLCLTKAKIYLNNCSFDVQFLVFHLPAAALGGGGILMENKFF